MVDVVEFQLVDLRVADHEFIVVDFLHLDVLLVFEVVGEVDNHVDAVFRLDDVLRFYEGIEAVVEVVKTLLVFQIDVIDVNHLGNVLPHVGHVNQVLPELLAIDNGLIGDHH